MLFLWHKTFSSHINLYLFFSRIFSSKISVYNGFITFHIGIPFINAPLLFPRRLIYFRFFTSFYRIHFVHCLVIQINTACMFFILGKIPIPINRCCIWVITIKHAIIDSGHPHITFIKFPSVNFFRTGNNCF